MKFLCIYRTSMLLWHWLLSNSLFKQHVWCFLVPLCVMCKQGLYKDEVVPHIVVRHLLCFEYVCCRRDYSEIRWGSWTWIDMPFLSSASVVTHRVMGKSLCWYELSNILHNSPYRTERESWEDHCKLYTWVQVLAHNSSNFWRCLCPRTYKTTTTENNEFKLRCGYSLIWLLGSWVLLSHHSITRQRSELDYEALW